MPLPRPRPLQTIVVLVYGVVLGTLLPAPAPVLRLPPVVVPAPYRPAGVPEIGEAPEMAAERTEPRAMTAPRWEVDTLPAAPTTAVALPGGRRAPPRSAAGPPSGAPAPARRPGISRACAVVLGDASSEEARRCRREAEQRRRSLCPPGAGAREGRSVICVRSED